MSIHGRISGSKRVNDLAASESGWTILDMRRQVSDSPGSDDWEELLCCRAMENGVEFAVCAYEWDESGTETDELSCNSDTYTVSRISSDNIATALDRLDWAADKALITHVAASIPRR